MYYYIPIAPLSTLTRAVGSMELIEEQKDFAAGWFACGDEIVYPIPSDSSKYPSSCAANGVVGKILIGDPHQFASTDAAAYAKSVSRSACPDLYPTICATVGYLPPYSCTKKVYLSASAVLGTAVADTHLLLSMVLFAFGMMLSRIAKQYPPAPADAVTEATAEADLEEQRRRDANDVEMVAVGGASGADQIASSDGRDRDSAFSTTNPMSK